MVEVPKRALQTGRVAGLRAMEDGTRLRLATQAAGVAVFDWDVAADTIVWDGALDILPRHLDLGSGRLFLDSLAEAGRARLEELLASHAPEATGFVIDIDIAFAMGAVGFTLVGSRMPGAGGATHRLAGVMRESTDRQRELQRLGYLARHDELTGHLNRNSLRAELTLAIERATAESRHCAFLVASIDRLAMVNDGFGLDAGDEVIVGVGERLARSLRGSDVIGRTAGNKFGVILKNCSAGEMDVVAGRLKRAVRDTAIETRGGTVFATCSMGAVWLPDGAATSQEAMLHAEEALDHARGRGRDGYAVYEPSPQRECRRLRQMAIADETVRALREGRLRLAFQPIVAAATRHVGHYEALLRMVKEDGTVLAAGHFVPAAEQMGIVHLIDRHALEQAIAMLRTHPRIVLAVNVSGTAADDPVWLQDFLDHLAAHRDVADRLIVELTETAALQRFEDNGRFITRLRELGARVAIDDFGAGYTSFRNLRLLKVDMVKIDGAYVKDLAANPENQVFVRTLVGLARNLGLATVAEWVDCDADAALLQQFGVDYFQGFHFGAPKLEPDWMEG